MGIFLGQFGVSNRPKHKCFWTVGTNWSIWRKPSGRTQKTITLLPLLPQNNSTGGDGVIYWCWFRTGATYLLFHRSGATSQRHFRHLRRRCSAPEKRDHGNKRRFSLQLPISISAAVLGDADTISLASLAVVSLCLQLQSRSDKKKTWRTCFRARASLGHSPAPILGRNSAPSV